MSDRNSFTSEPGAMAYDRDNDPPRTNAECPLCWQQFWRRADDDGPICTTCADAADWRAQERKRMAKAALKPAANKKGQL